jgi:hypothetical protein
MKAGRNLHLDQHALPAYGIVSGKMAQGLIHRRFYSITHNICIYFRALERSI